MAIKRDYLGVWGDPSTPLLGAEFPLMFRLSRGRFQVLMEDIMASSINFYKSTNSDGLKGSSLQARLLLPLKSLAFGVPPHAFIDYFQMSPSHAEDCCKQFDKAIRLIYEKEFLRCSASADIKKILKLHRHIHHVHGLLGSLDCTHTHWKNCPKAWHSSYQGKEGKSTIVLECLETIISFFGMLLMAILGP